LIGLDVYEDQGSYLGQLIQILRTGANDVYLIENQAGDETLIPAIEDVILEVDLKQKKMLVFKLKWYGGGT
jgi:16S rRNA processing protein RimM